MAALTNWPLPIAFGYVLLAQLAGLAAATWFLSKLRRTLWPWALGSGAGLILILALSYPQTTALTNLLLLIGQVLLSLLIAVVLIGIMASSKDTQHSGIAVANGIGMLLLLMFILAYYAVYDISLPYSNVLLEPIAAFIIAICAIGVPIALHHEIKADHKVWAVPVLALILLIVPIAGIITWQPPAAAPGKGFPIRIMTYNLHNGFNADGYLDMESLAQVIEDSNPDIVALQEVSRGWVVNGRFDMITWLSHRLDMPYVFGPTTGPLWGNAILSRYPILGYTQRDLPPRDLFLLRGLTVALIDLGNDTRLKVVATHFHHLDGDTDIRQLQAGVTLDFLAGADRTVLLGDFNAHANDREMEMFRQAGLVDTAAALDPAPACTFPSTNPQKRIDYIWLSTDLKVNCIQVPVSNASDHLPVIAVIDE